MRVRFFAPDDEEETSSFVRFCDGIDDFWRRFDRVCAEPPSRWVSDLRAVLARVHDDLGLETREQRDGTRTLAIVPLGGPASGPLARLCVQRAPMRYPWSFESERERWPLDQCIAAVSDDCGVDLTGARARVGITRGHLLEVALANPEFEPHDPTAIEAAERLVSLLLGDARWNAWIAGVSVQAAPSSRLLRVVGHGEIPELPLALCEVDAAIEAAVAGILLGLPDAPLHAACENAEWTLFELDDMLRVADAGSRPEWRTRPAVASGALSTAPPLCSTPPLCTTPPQADLLLAASACPEALKFLLSEQPFSSRRFSRHGERFCYLKLRVDAANDEGRCHHRSELEDALDRALVPGRLGCVVGNGLGQEHVYVDLALSNVEASIPVVRSRLERAGIHGDAWMFFFDDEWSNEWLALNERTQRPTSR
jgi:hypothetical protein